MSQYAFLISGIAGLVFLAGIGLHAIICSVFDVFARKYEREYFQGRNNLLRKGLEDAGKEVQALKKTVTSQGVTIGALKKQKVAEFSNGVKFGVSSIISCLESPDSTSGSVYVSEEVKKFKRNYRITDLNKGGES